MFMFVSVLNFIPLVFLHTYSAIILIKTCKVSSCVFLTPANKNPLEKEKKIEKSRGTCPETEEHPKKRENIKVPRRSQKRALLTHTVRNFDKLKY